VLLLVPSEHSRRLNDTVWDYVDDIIWTSVGEQNDSLDTFEFTGRVRSLLRARSMSQTVIEDQQRLKVLHRVLRHNLRNSLNIVRGSAKSIDGPDAADHVNRIVRETNRLLGHSEKAQDIEQILERSTEQHIDLAGRVQQAIDSYGEEFPDAEISIDVRSSVRVTSVVGITRTIEEIIHNSLIHAVSETPSVAITVEQVDGFGVMTVEDSNPTISEQDRQVLRGDLEPTALDHGSGVGLWLVVWTVRQSNGQVRYHALETGGNRIQIRLPAQTPS
jgi:signal transduction histidine kinase